MVDEIEQYAGLVAGRATFYLATIYESPAEALAQAVDNGRDALAKNIWIVMEPNKITITDDGNGMIPNLLEEDEPYFQMMQEVQTQNVDLSLEEIRKLISEPSRKSVRWMMQFGSFSAKNPDEGGTGEKGIGHLAYLTYGESATLTTVPHIRLARAYYGQNIKQDEVPAHGIELHTREQLLRDDMRYRILPDVVPLTNPMGEKLLHGTRIEVTNLIEGIEREIAPKMLASYLKTRFGPSIKEGRLTIQIIDKMTKEGRSTPEGRILTVEPVKYTGELVLETKLNTDALSGNVPYMVVIYYDREGKYKNGIELRKRGEPAGNLSSIEEFNTAPWNSGNFGGFVEFPTLPNEDVLWTPKKDTLLPTPERRKFVTKVLMLQPKLESFLDTKRLALREARRDETVARIEEAASLALQNVESIQHLAISSKRRERKKPDPKSPSGQRAQQEPATVVVKVLDEHNRGVPQVEIQLWSNHRKLKSDKTGLSGTISLGTIPGSDRDKNHYLRIVVPAGARLLELQEPQYKFKPNKLGGFSWIFRLRTGEKPTARKIPSVKIVRTDKFPDPMILWQQKLGIGVLEFNQNSPEYLDAEASGNDDMLLADYAASAIVEYGFPTLPVHYLMQQQSLIFGEMLKYAREGVQRSKRRRKA